MGPRARARGNRYIQRTDGQPWWLQWGHERALVEIRTLARALLLLAGLQWGHERALVEIGRRASGGCRYPGLQWGHERALVEIASAGIFSFLSTQLQWGHERALVEMKLHQERYYRSDASMGPRARARGNEQCCDLGGGCIGASMGPRARARGNAGVWETLCQVRRASMGPRARARGNAAGIAELRCKRCGLQWGHERALVEIWFRFLRGGAPEWLQWGHERALVEIQTTRARDTRAMCFNGATSARSWK